MIGVEIETAERAGEVLERGDSLRTGLRIRTNSVAKREMPTYRGSA